MSCERRRKELATTLLHVFQTHDAPNDIEAPEKSHASVHMTTEHVGFTEEAIGDLPGQCRYPEGSDTQDRKDNVLGIRKREKVSSYSAFAYLIYVFRWFNSSGHPRTCLLPRADRVVIVEITDRVLVWCEGNICFGGNFRRVTERKRRD